MVMVVIVIDKVTTYITSTTRQTHEKMNIATI